MDGSSDSQPNTSSGTKQTKIMSDKDWIQKWEKKEIGFHEEKVHKLLAEFLEIMLHNRKQITIFFPLCGKAVDMKCSVVGRFDGIWDRGSMVAVNPNDRQRYANVILSLMNKDCCYLLVTVEYDTKVYPGPPYYVSGAELEKLLGLSCSFKILKTADTLTDRHRKLGMDFFETKLYHITPKADS